MTMPRLALLLAAAGILAAQPRRIVSTAPSITETLFALGLGSRVVGVSEYCHYPPQAAKLPKVGSYMKPNTEVIARLKPDLVILDVLPNTAAQQLHALGVPVVPVSVGDLQHNLDAILTIGRAAGAEPEARKLIADLHARLDRLRSRAKSLPVRDIVFIVGRTPGRLEDLVVVGGGAYLSELMAIAGGRNIFASESRPYLKTSLESILRRNPAVLLDMGEMAETVGVTEQQKRTVEALWRTADPPLRATRVHAVASDIYVVPGPRMVDAAEAFFRYLHPE